MSKVAHELGLLVLVDVLWARWAPLTKEPAAEQPWCQQDRLLGSLLHGADGYGPAALLHSPRHKEFKEAWERAGTTERRTVNELLTYYPSEQQWSPPEHLERQRREIVTGLEVCCTALTREKGIPPELLEAATNLYTHRVYLHGQQLSRLGAEPSTDARPGLDPWWGLHACLDFRVRHQLGTFWLYATISLWSSRPRSIAHAPPGRRTHHAPGTIGELTALFQGWRDSFKESLLQHYLTIEPTVLQEADAVSFRRKYRPPRFWIVGCRGHQEAREPTHRCDVVEGMCREALDVPGPGAVDVVHEVVESSNRIGEDQEMPLLVVRRLKPLDDGAAPAYVVAPCRDGDEALQEDAVQELVYAFTDVETRIAAHLLDVTTELDIDDCFARIYEAVVYRASELWDQLAMRLPLLRGRELDELHQVIELVHLTLLQGLADLGYLKAKVSREAALLESDNDADVERLTQSFIGVSAPDERGGLGESLRSGGYVRPTRRWARDVDVSTTSALEHFTSLLDAISKAFDERRVRETDRIASYGLVVAVVLGVVGFAAETWGAFIGNRGDPIPLLALAGLITVAAVLGRLIWARWFRALGSLTTTDYFRTAYPPVCDYLQLCRTERIARLDGLERRRRRDDLADEHTDDLDSYVGYHARWHELDLRLARQYAAVVDRLHEVSAQSRPDGSLGALRGAVEQWAVHAHLLSERPREFYRCPLPCLAMMYRFYPAYPDSAGLIGREGRLLSVSDADLLLTLRVQCGAELDHVSTVVAWGDLLNTKAQKEKLSAANMLEEIVASGLRSGVSVKEWGRTYQYIEREVGDRLTDGPHPPGHERDRAAPDAPATRNGRPPTVVPS